MQVTVTVRTIEQKFTGGTVGGDWRIELSLAIEPTAIAFEYEGASPSSTFDLPDNTPPDVYVIRGVRKDAAGDVLGPIATTQYTVGEDLVAIDVAGTISAVASPGTKAAPADGVLRR